MPDPNTTPKTYTHYQKGACTVCHHAFDMITGDTEPQTDDLKTDDLIMCFHCGGLLYIDRAGVTVTLPAPMLAALTDEERTQIEAMDKHRAKLIAARSGRRSLLEN